MYLRDQSHSGMHNTTVMNSMAVENFGANMLRKDDVGTIQRNNLEEKSGGANNQGENFKFFGQSPGEALHYNVLGKTDNGAVGGFPYNRPVNAQKLPVQEDHGRNFMATDNDMEDIDLPDYMRSTAVKQQNAPASPPSPKKMKDQIIDLINNSVKEERPIANNNGPTSEMDYYLPPAKQDMRGAFGYPGQKNTQPFTQNPLESTPFVKNQILHHNQQQTQQQAGFNTYGPYVGQLQNNPTPSWVPFNHVAPALQNPYLNSGVPQNPMYYQNAFTGAGQVSSPPTNTQGFRSQVPSANTGIYQYSSNSSANNAQQPPQGYQQPVQDINPYSMKPQLSPAFDQRQQQAFQQLPTGKNPYIAGGGSAGGQGQGQNDRTRYILEQTYL